MKSLRKFRILVSALVLVGALMVVTAGVTLAAGPHEGTFTTTSDACAGCHRLHSASAAKLLKSFPSQYNMCMSCHDGTGANTKETTGVYLGTANGTTNAGLRGGGFEQALMNVNLAGGFDTVGPPAPITSRHSVNGTAMISWGSGLTGVGESVDLVCGNCHNPHGNANYRILRPQPTSLAGWAGLSPITVSGGVADNYTVVYTANLTRDLTLYGGNVTSVIGNWCGQCHTRYLAGIGSGSTANTTPYLYRHMTDGLNGECLRCHSAHGTSANMTGWASASNMTWPDGNATKAWQSGTEGQSSRLLTINNRGVCLQCHSSAALTVN